MKININKNWMNFKKRCVRVKKINVETWNRKKIFEWFKSFSNACYSITNEIDVTTIVKYTKESNTSFFINFLYVVVKTLNEFECMKMRLVNDKPVIYSEISPAYTVAKDELYENVRHEYKDNYSEFYSIAHLNIEKVKKGIVDGGSYNPVNCYNEYYITCIPWITFSSLNHPLPDDKGSQSIPRLCWGKYHEVKDKTVMDFNITVNHMFCDGKDVCSFLIKLQENINSIYYLVK
jgi:chloramphenicol O-acetyltransferase